MWLTVGRCMRWRNADVIEEFRWFLSKIEALIARQSRRGIVRKKFGRIGESRLSSLSKFRWQDGVNWTWSKSIVYTSLRIYLTTTGLLFISLTNPFFEDATWCFASASCSSTVANRCLLQIWRKDGRPGQGPWGDLCRCFLLRYQWLGRWY